MAADRGDSTAPYNIAMLYAKGSGVKKNYEQAMAWFYKAKDRGDEDVFVAIRNLRRQVAAEEGFLGSENGVVSPEALALLHDIWPRIMKSHNAGDWGVITLDRELLNMRALKNRDWVQSEYPIRGVVAIVRTDPTRSANHLFIRGEEDRY
jgi:TPR repeat protein